MTIIPGTTGVTTIQAGVRPARSEEIRPPDERPPIPPPAPVQTGPQTVRDQKHSERNRLDVRA